MLLLPRKLVYLCHLGFCHFPRKYTANALAAGMHVQHDLRGLFTRHRKEYLQHLNHELHRSEIIVEQHHLEQWWLGHLWPGFFDRQTVVAFRRSEEHTSELQSLMRHSYAV